MSITLYSRYPMSTDQFADFVLNIMEWTELKSSAKTRVFEIAELDAGVGTVEVWQVGQFIQGSAQGYVGDFLEPFFFTPDDGKMFERVERLHEISRKSAECTCGLDCHNWALAVQLDMIKRES